MNLETAARRQPTVSLDRGEDTFDLIHALGRSAAIPFTTKQLINLDVDGSPVHVLGEQAAQSLAYEGLLNGGLLGRVILVGAATSPTIWATADAVKPWAVITTLATTGIEELAGWLAPMIDDACRAAGTVVV